MAAIASADPRYAPEDPSLPKPWKGLVDGKTGYLYYWNPETNITQYERPGGSAPIHKSSAGFVSSSVQKSSHGQHRDNDDVDRYGRSHRGSSKPSGGEDYQCVDLPQPSPSNCRRPPTVVASNNLEGHNLPTSAHSRRGTNAPILSYSCHRNTSMIDEEEQNEEEKDPFPNDDDDVQDDDDQVGGNEDIDDDNEGQGNMSDFLMDISYLFIVLSSW